MILIPQRYVTCSIQLIRVYPPCLQIEIDAEELQAIRRMRELEREEPLLQENPRRFVLFPIEHQDIWLFYKKAKGTNCHFPVRLLRLVFFFPPQRPFGPSRK